MTTDRLPPRPTGRLRVVIDTDAANEIDDQFALAWALLADDVLDVEAIHAAPFAHGAYFEALDRARTARGGESATAFEKMAERVGSERIAEMQAEHPPADGMARSVIEIQRITRAVEPVRTPAVVAGSDRFMAHSDDAVDSDAVRDLITRAHDGPGPLFVPMLGAATNVASALIIDPTIATRIVPVFVAGHPSASSHVDDSFNLVQDRHATNRLFASAPHLVYIPGHQVAVVLSVSLPELEQHVAGHGLIGDVLVQLYHDNPLATAPTTPGHSWIMWDLAPIAWLIDPTWVPTHVIGNAMLGPEHRWQPGDGELTEAVRVDRRAVFTDFFARLALL